MHKIKISKTNISAREWQHHGDFLYLPEWTLQADLSMFNVSEFKVHVDPYSFSKTETVDQPICLWKE